MMNDLRKTLAVELFKLRRQKSTYIVPSALVVLVVTMVFVLEFAARRDWIGVPDGYFITASVMSWMNNIMVLLAVIVTSFTIAQEFALGTVKQAWVRPVTRGQWFTGKLVFTGGILTDLFIAGALATVITVLFRLGYTDLMEKDFLVHSSRELAARLALVCALTLWSLWATTVVVGMIAAMFSHPGGAIAAGLGTGVAMMVLAAVEPVRPILLTHYVSLPFEQMVAMSKGLPLPLEWRDLTTRCLAVPGIWMVVAFIVGQRVVRGREVSS